MYRAVRSGLRSGVLGKLRALLVWSLIFSLTAMAQEQIARTGLIAPSVAGSSLAQSEQEQSPATSPASAQSSAAEQSPSDRTRARGNEAETSSSEKSSKTKEQPSPAKTKPVELTEFQKLVASSLGKTLPIYGQELFQTVPTTFAPIDRVPVTANYVVGPGDELLIRGWGQIDLDVSARVDRNGAIYIPKVGNLNVAGLRFEQLQGYLKAQIGRIYQNFDLSVSMGELRSIDIYVVGQASRPGRYTVSSLSTLANAVFASGGPSPSGSMRHIELKRAGKVVADFDLYDLLIRGDKSKDVPLMPEDVIYFAPIGPVVAMGGEVNNPAIYEMRGELVLKQALELAGGLATTAYGGKAYVERIKGREERSIEEVKLDSTGLAHLLRDGDVWNFSPISPRFVDAVTLRGNVATPGRYPWHEGMRVTDLIPNREFLITREYWKQQNAITLQTQTGNATVGATETSNGATNTTGAAATKAALNDVVRNAPEINWDYAVIQRISQQDLSTELLPFNLGKAVLQHEEASNLLLQPGDIVTIFSQADLRVPREQQTKLVRLEGEFAAAGVYRAQSGETLRDLVLKSGGLAPSAYLYGAVFTRVSTKVQQQQRLELLISQMEKDLARQSELAALNARTADEANAARMAAEAQRTTLNKLRELKADGRVVLNFHPNDSGVEDIPAIALEDGDELYVPSRPIVVSVFGDVYNQGSFLQRPGKTVYRYLRDAGGPTRNADKNRVFVVLANGSVVSKEAAAGFWSGGFDSMVLMPGDTVIVPEQLNPGQGWRHFKDFAQILFDFGLAAAAIHVLTQ
ncbi:MAG TPA: SLBB domain-containing protein [Candidatus Bathyarchaeia archaeon]|nr:SLBB domain-containing protein [Candidatus Bathyarchaeia archaeon]